MPGLPITLICADYARVLPLAADLVAADGIDLTLVLGRDGSWPMRAEILRRSIADPTVHGGEASMAAHLRRLDAGDRSIVALPVFPLRNFTARDLYVRKGGGMEQPADLIGRRIGMYDYAASGSIWYRHFLRFAGVQPEQVTWFIGEVDEPAITTQSFDLPAGAHRVPSGQPLSEMLLAGELEAIYSPPRPRRYHPQLGPIVRLFSDVRAVEAAYFRATGMFPPQHLIVLRRDVWEANKWIARSLTAAFIRCNEAFTRSQRAFPYAAPWLDMELEATEALMGADFHADGFDANCRTIEVFAEQAQAVGIVRRRISAEEYFAEFLDS